VSTASILIEEEEGEGEEGEEGEGEPGQDFFCFFSFLFSSLMRSPILCPFLSERMPDH
jgi:hypothetical protein